MTAIPTGTFAIDTSHSEIGFVVRHSGIAKVRGRFTDFVGSFTVAENFADSSAQVTIQSGSVHTGNEQRDAHLRSADFWNAEENPEWTFTSTSVEGSGEEFVLHGDLTVNGVTRPVALEAEFNGAIGAEGEETLGFTIETEISRKDFGLTFNVVLDGGNLLVGDKVKVAIEVEAVRELVTA
ncbi:YceI family protein [Ruania albidiflava]|uniref:YceI family protein n=1 Tax=Ruania albidiflava TaxID=366586 RepID=UPI00042A14BA|nr:YceI family protein [Ruania albidiflava]